MNKKLTTTQTCRLALVAAAILAAAQTQAADITFAAPVSATNTSVLDIPWLAGGTFVQGFTYGSGAKSFTTAGGQSISLADGRGASLGNNVIMPAGTPSGTGGFYNAGGNQWNNAGVSTDLQAWTDALDGNIYHGTATATDPLTLHLVGLTVGQTYDLSLFTTDNRGGSAGRTQDYWSSFSGTTYSGGTSGSFSETASEMVLGTFTADAVYQDIFLQATETGNPDTTLSIYTLYAVPEPSAMALAALGGASLLFRRRRA